MDDDAAYYRRRAHEEIGAAMNADSTVARQTHLELAKNYTELADVLERRDAESFAKSAPDHAASKL